MPDDLHIVVIAGGSGTRFWPLSRRRQPKQLLTLKGSDTLLGATFSRVRGFVAAERWWMVVSRDHADACQKSASAVPVAHVLLEPLARNTAPAICLAALHIAATNPQAIMVVLPADHYVAEPDKLNRALATAAEAAGDGTIVTLGVSPTAPDVGYGYVQRGAPDPCVAGVFRVLRFWEKPDVERARGFLREGGYEWNAGIFIAKVGTILAEVERQLPGVYSALQHAVSLYGQQGYEDALAAAYQSISNISFDCGVMEGARDVRTVPVACGWSDVGSFAQLGSVLGRDASGNVTSGKVVSVDANNCVLHAGPGQVVAAVGVSGLAVIQTADATLVVALDRVQEIRDVVTRLGDNGWNEYL